MKACAPLIWPKTQAEYDALVARWQRHQGRCDWFYEAERCVMQWMPPEFWAKNRPLAEKATDR